MALSDQCGSSTFRIQAFTAASSLLPVHEKATEYWPAPALQLREEIEVPISTVDQICVELGLDQIDLLKIDVQGYEYQVLEGASELLGRQAARLVYFEYIHCQTYEGQRDLAEYFSLLSGWGYQLVSIFNLVQGKEGLNQCDLLFQPKPQD